MMLEQLTGALNAVRYPGYTRTLQSFGLIEGIEVHGNHAKVTLSIGHLSAPVRQAILEAVKSATAFVPDDMTVELVLTAPKPKGPARGGRPPGIHQAMAVVSGKGGVGKSTVATNLAVAFTMLGLRTGLLDADVHGPSLPRMMGASGQLHSKDGKIQPLHNHGVTLVSTGFMVDAASPVVWRGPMTDKLIRQFMRDVDWGELDLLVADMPPGTGDIALALGNYLEPEGAVVVVTPQSVAVDDARKAAAMLRKQNIPILGIIENMSVFHCPGCGQDHTLFGTGGGRQLADEFGVPFLGTVPIDPGAREGGDAGVPVVLDESSSAGKALIAIAAKLRHILLESPGIPDRPNHEGASADAAPSNKSHGTTTLTAGIIDVRTIPPPQRHPLIFKTFDELAQGTYFHLHNDHDPRPLRGQFEQNRAGAFTWEYLESGPDLFRIQIGKL